MLTQTIIYGGLICLIGMLIVFIGLYMLILCTGFMKRLFNPPQPSPQEKVLVPIPFAPVSTTDPTVSSASSGLNPEIVAVISAVLCLNQPAVDSSAPSSCLSLESWVSLQRYSAMTAYRKK